MFGWFKKDKKKEDGEGVVTQSQDAVNISHLSPAKQALFAQMRQVRADIGEEEIQKMQAALQHEATKKKIRQDIDTDEGKRQRLVDELKMTLKDGK